MRRGLIVAACVVLTSHFTFAVTVTPSELDLRHRWVAAKFEGAGKLPPIQAPRLVVIENHDPVQRNARAGKPLRIGERSFARGLYCHANSKVLVTGLPAGAVAFDAVVGVDSNEQTSGGRGSIVFGVRVDGRELVRSDRTTEATPARDVHVDLADARELALFVEDASDGISCDQADWAEARITLRDGSTIWLGDLPIADDSTIPTSPVFSFALDGRPSSDVLKTITPTRTREQIDDQRIRHRVVYVDAASGLTFSVEGIEYVAYPTVEWTVYVRNDGKTDSPVIEGLRAVDATFSRGAGGEFVLHHHTGSPCLLIDYQPHEAKLGPGESKTIATLGGRSTNSNLPFFNIEWEGRGAIIAMGWPGQWSATFERDPGQSLRVVGGQELTHFRLKPGEQVRTPLVVLQFYEGPAVRAQNVWRRWMIAHNMPHPGGKPPAPMTGACSSHQFHEMIQANEENQKLFVSRYVEENLSLDYWWMDAGWYVNNGDWPNTGTWKVDRNRFPGGLRAISDHARKLGVKTIVWFEPERVNPGTELYTQHTNWLLGKEGGDKLLNLGEPEARKWWTDRADALIVSEGIDLYRTDHNIDPLPFWRANDMQDRQGITENRYAQGFLAYLDELRRRHPDLLIDTCASGGRRNDLETLRRAVPLLRSDYILEPVGQQNHTMGIASWIPYFRTGVNSPDPYAFRSQMCPWITCCYDMRRKDLDFDALRRRHSEWKTISGYLLQDFYPLTPYTTDNVSWVAWQFDDPESGAGAVLAFRRGQSIYQSAELRFAAIDASRNYVVTDLDTRESRELAGAALKEGLLVTMKHAPDSVVLTYRRR